jgi:hypothetical protein
MEVKMLNSALALGLLFAGPALVHATLALLTFVVVPTLIGSARAAPAVGAARPSKVPLGRPHSRRARLVLADADAYANIRVQV